MSNSGPSLSGATEEQKIRLVVEKTLRIPVLTTAERNKLKLEKGLIVFNSSLGKMQIHDGTDWISVH